jgi:RND family efflux transporter MFP subunit
MCSTTVLAAALVAACGQETVERPEVVRPVKTQVFGAAGLGSGLEYSGVVQATREADLSFEVPGRVVEFPVVEGQRVRTGTLLARLDPRDYEAQRDAAAAERNAAEADYTRYQELYAAAAVSLQELEVRQRNFQVSDARLRTADKTVTDTRLLAPFDGQVARTIVNELEQVQARQPVLFFVDDSGLEVLINIPESDALRGTRYLSSAAAMADLNPRVTVSTLPGVTFPARLAEFASAADPVTRTFAATFAFAPPDDAAIRPGMTARIVLSAPAEPGEVSATSASLPVVSVMADDQGAPFVWRIDPTTMRVSQVPVQVGTVFGGEIAVTGGLEPGDLIAVSGVHNLRPGMQVREVVEAASD